MNLFAETERKNLWAAAPLAVRMRPRTLEEFAGQEDFIAPGKLLYRMLQADRLTSLIFYGPPGTGKTALAHVIARQTASEFISTNAATIGVAEIRKILAAAHDRLAVQNQRTILFLDEIHRFSKSQQDVLLNDVESGAVILIGVTTENPFFSVNSALVSRSTIFEFKPLAPDHLAALIRRALADKERGLGNYPVKITDDALNYLALMANGDARRALTALEIGVLSQLKQTAPTEKNQQKPPPKLKILNFDINLAVESIQQKSLVSDKSGDTHYDLASALQKSMRGSDPDATAYWLARLIVGGEDPRFIARRIAVTAAEDVGNADPMATVLAAAVVSIAEFIGLPEAQLPLAQAAIYIACAPKSNRSAQALWSAAKDVRQGQTAPVPDHLKDTHYGGAKKLGRGLEYQYPHSLPDAYAIQDYLPPEFAKQYYHPSPRGHEAHIQKFLQNLEQLKKNRPSSE